MPAKHSNMRRGVFQLGYLCERTVKTGEEETSRTRRYVWPSTYITVDRPSTSVAADTLLYVYPWSFVRCWVHDLPRSPHHLSYGNSHHQYTLRPHKADPPTTTARHPGVTATGLRSLLHERKRWRRDPLPHSTPFPLQQPPLYNNVHTPHPP